MHLAIDWTKVRLISSSKIGDGAASFLGDQAVHFITVAITGWFIARPSTASVVAKSWLSIADRETASPVSCIRGVIFGGGYLVRFVTKPLLKSNLEVIGESTNELQNAGMYITWLERFVVLTSLVLQSPATVGLILAAKSIARYPELKSVRFCRVLPHWHAVKCDIRNSRRARIAEGILRRRNPREMNAWFYPCWNVLFFVATEGIGWGGRFLRTFGVPGLRSLLGLRAGPEGELVSDSWRCSERGNNKVRKDRVHSNACLLRVKGGRISDCVRDCSDVRRAVAWT